MLQDRKLSGAQSRCGRAMEENMPLAFEHDINFDAATDDGII
jgi:hypothetical protein